MTTQPPFDLVAAARDRRKEIARLRESLDREDAEIKAFLTAADSLSKKLAPATIAPPPATEGAPRRVGKAEVTEAAKALLLESRGEPITTGQVAQRLLSENFQFSGGSSPSSVVSAYLGQANDIIRAPGAGGWIARPSSWIDEEISKTL